MEASQFDTLALHVARLTTRRAISRLVLGLPALAAALIGGGLDPTSVDAEDDDHGSSHRRRRRRTRHKHRRNRVRRNKKPKKRKKPKKHKPKCRPRSCPANGCGPMADGCGGTLQCGGCGTNHLCVDGTCRTCDVCQPEGACAFTSVQAAIEATPQLETIVVCPGIYIEHARITSAIAITRSLRLVGAGDGDDPATNTILRPRFSDLVVVRILPPGSATPQVTLERVQVAGATGTNVVGLHVRDAIVDLIGCTITGNSSFLQPGGIHAFNSQMTLTDTRVTGNTGGETGGIWVTDGSQVTLDTLTRVTGNRATGDVFGTGFGGIRAVDGTNVVLPSVDNVTGNTSKPDTLPNCGGGGTFDGDGAVCTTT